MGLVGRILRWLGLGVLLLLAIGVAGTFLPRPFMRFAESATDASPARTVFLLSNPIHTDIALPADPDILTRFGFLADAGLDMGHSGLRWIVIGWGGRAFYLETPTWGDLKPMPVVKALTVDSAVMHVSLSGEITAGENAMEISLSTPKFDALVDRIAQSFSRNGQGPILIDGAGYGAFDRFYEGEGRFNALLGCNTWTSGVLRVAGLRTGAWNPLPQSLNWSIRLFNSCNGNGCRAGR